MVFEQLIVLFVVPVLQLNYVVVFDLTRLVFVLILEHLVVPDFRFVVVDWTHVAFEPHRKHRLLLDFQMNCFELAQDVDRNHAVFDYLGNYFAAADWNCAAFENYYVQFEYLVDLEEFHLVSDWPSVLFVVDFRSIVVVQYPQYHQN